MTPRLLIAACALGLFAAPAPAPQVPRKNLPPVPSKQLPASSSTKLSLYIGGAIFPPNYNVTLNGDTLTYWVQSLDPATQKPLEISQTIKPSPEQWREFWKSMDEVGLWSWKPVYEDFHLMDGTHWSVQATHDGRSVRSRGRIYFPGQDTPDKPGEIRNDSGPLFEKYLAAVRKLIGDRPFH